MKREIKFRSFCDGKMIDLKKITPLALDPKFPGDGLFLPFDDKYPLMQYVGLVDKKGNEIYEGDIFQVAGNKIYQIRYFAGESNFEWYGAVFVLYLNETTFFPFDEYAIKHGIVIGNVYQHPELLEVQSAAE